MAIPAHLFLLSLFFTPLPTHKHTVEDVFFPPLHIKHFCRHNNNISDLWNAKKVSEKQ